MKVVVLIDEPDCFQLTEEVQKAFPIADSIQYGGEGEVYFTDIEHFGSVPEGARAYIWPDDCEKKGKRKKPEQSVLRGTVALVRQKQEYYTEEIEDLEWNSSSLRRVLPDVGEPIALDTETVGLEDITLLGLSISGREKKGLYIPLRTDNDRFQVRGLIAELSGRYQVIWHNAPFDLRAIGNYNAYSHDTRVMSWLLSYKGQSLEELTKIVLGERHLTFKDLFGTDKVDVTQLPLEQLALKSCGDVDHTLRLFNIFKPQLESWEMWSPLYTDIEMPLLPILMKMKDRGIEVDPTRREALRGVVQAQLDNLGGVLVSLGMDFDRRSYDQMSDYLYNKKGYPVLKSTGTGRPAIDEFVLKQLEHLDPAITVLLMERGLQKQLSTFLSSEEGVIHATFNQCNTETGRLSCTGPNLQQVPEMFRLMYQVREGYVFVGADYNQIEMRIMAHASGDPALVEGYKTPGWSIHEDTMQKLGISKRLAKAINFGIPYGAEEYTISEKTGLSMEEAGAILRLHREGYPVLHRHMADERQFALQNGFMRTLPPAGRVRQFPALRLPGATALHQKALREAVNMPIQGCVEGSSRILTKESGCIPIAFLVGEQVTIWDGERWAKASVVSSGLKSLIRVELYGGQVIQCSSDHRFLILNNKGVQSWKKPIEIKGQDRVRLTSTPPFWSSSRTLPVSQKPRAHNGISVDLNDIEEEKLGELLGRLASDGSVLKTGLTWLVAEHEAEILPGLLEGLARLGHLTIRTVQKPSAGKWLLSLTLSRATLAKLLKEEGIKQRIPDFVWGSSTLLSSYLRGLFDGDGTVSQDGPILTFGKGSKKLIWAQDVQEALLLFGIFSRIRVYEKDRTVVQVAKRDVGTFAQRIGFLNPLKQEKLYRVIPKKEWGTLYGRAQRVRSISEMGEAVPMYDVLDAEYGQFAVGGVVTHNSNADITKAAMIELDPIAEEYGAHLLLQIHDELVYEVPEGVVEKWIPQQVKHMTEPKIRPEGLEMKVNVHVGKYWSDLK